MDPPKPMATVINATALAVKSELARGQKKNVKTRPTKAPAIMAPVSCPYWPRMPQPMPPAMALSRITSKGDGAATCCWGDS